MTILFENTTEDGFDFDEEPLITKVIEECLQSECCPFTCEINVTFTDNEGIRQMNREFRELDVPTDVLSFPMIEFEQPSDFSIIDADEDLYTHFNPDTKELLLGDIVISIPRAKEQALEYGHSIQREIAFLTAHSMLHLMGYDHIQEEERLEMEQRQENVLQKLGITREEEGC